MIDTDFLKKIARIACDAAVSEGAQFADVSAAYGKSLSTDINASAIKASEARQGGGISVRAIFKGGTGWSSSDKLTEDSAAEAGKNAAKLAKLAEPDPDFISLPSPADNYPQIEGLVDRSIADIDIKQIIKWSIDNIKEAQGIYASAIVSGGFSADFSASALVNSLGVDLGRESSSIYGSIMVVVRDNEDVGSFYDFDAARQFSDFNPEGIGTKAARQAMKFFGAKKIETGRMPVILGPMASRSIFSAIIGAADAEDVMRGRSFLIGKVGEKIASDVLSITDDPLIPSGLSSRAYDSEGCPCKPLVVMENGVLKSYLYGSYSAGKAKMPNTGHGTRGGGASFSNIIPKLGSLSSEEIIKSTKEGLYINMGGIDPNNITGEVSCAVDFGFKIEDGHLAYPVMSSMIGGSFLDMLKNIDAVSSDCREEPGMIMPTLRIQDVLVAGGK